VFIFQHRKKKEKKRREEKGRGRKRGNGKEGRRGRKRRRKIVGWGVGSSMVEHLSSMQECLCFTPYLWGWVEKNVRTSH
jgi:hypothetical protein